MRSDRDRPGPVGNGAPLRWLAVTFLVGQLAACGPNSDSTSLPVAETVSTSRAAITTTSTTAASTTTTTTVPGLPEVDLADPLVWFAPNMGSVDFPQLFSEPELWVSAREQVDVFKFYGNNVWGFPYDIGGDNVLDTFVEVDAFQKLHEWGTAVALELGVVKFFACEPQSWVDYADLTINNIESNGGRVSFIAMDEPLIGGQVVENGETCGYSMEQTAQVVAEFSRAVTTSHPEVLIGDIEAYPHYSAADLEHWLVVLGEAGVVPAFFHLDVDIERVRVEGQDVASDLIRLRDFSEDRGIPFGVIFTSNWTASGSDPSYYQSTLEWAATVAAALGRPPHVVFQSWMGPAESGRHEVPINLPESSPDVYSHTRLVLDGLDVLG